MNGDQGLFVPLLLGILEGLTEFLPVSSTAHLLLIGHFLGFDSPGRVFEVLIQLGAILAIVVVYFAKLVAILRDALSGHRGALRFLGGVLLASLPAGLAGLVLHDFIKGVLYESPIIVSIALIVGGVILLYVDQLKLVPKYTDIYQYPPMLCLGIGLFQMLALLPGVSRSGATIVGSLLLGTDKRSAAEFTFYLALPIMIGATLQHVGNGWVFNSQGGGWEFPAFWTLLLVVQSLLGEGAFALKVPALNAHAARRELA